MANTNTIWQQAVHTTYKLSNHLLTAQQEPYKKAHLLTGKKSWENEPDKKTGEWTISIKMTRQKEQQN